jgi:hypothetical protein
MITRMYNSNFAKLILVFALLYQRHHSIKDSANNTHITFLSLMCIYR